MLGGSRNIFPDHNQTPKRLDPFATEYFVCLCVNPIPLRILADTDTLGILYFQLRNHIGDDDFISRLCCKCFNTLEKLKKHVKKSHLKDLIDVEVRRNGLFTNPSCNTSPCPWFTKDPLRRCDRYELRDVKSFRENLTEEELKDKKKHLKYNICENHIFGEGSRESIHGNDKITFYSYEEPTILSSPLLPRPIEQPINSVNVIGPFNSNPQHVPYFQQVLPGVGLEDFSLNPSGTAVRSFVSNFSHLSNHSNLYFSSHEHPALDTLTSSTRDRLEVEQDGTSITLEAEFGDNNEDNQYPIL
eukprot:Nk52_evm43s163 gene=Nk52_evmTU43s163